MGKNRFVHTFCVAATAKLKHKIESGGKLASEHPIPFSSSPRATVRAVRVDLIIKHN